MSPTLFSCVICGYLVDGFASSFWLKEFRAVYSSAEGTFISGIGLYADPNAGYWVVPSNSSLRWNDPGYKRSPHDMLSVMKQGPIDGRHGFVLHDSCWRLLQKFFEPDNVPVERLLSIYRLTEQHNSSDTHAKENPYDIAELPDLLSLSKSSEKRVESGPMAGGEDCFATFPWEIREAISFNLLVPDVLSLVRASRSFLPILTSQAFWASRFEPDNDRGFIFEKRNCREPRDWIMLYQLTSRASSPLGLKNRRRIWELIQASALPLRSHLSETLEPSASELDICSLKWREAAGDIQTEFISEHRAYFYNGCTLFRKQRAIIPSGLSRIAFSVTTNTVTANSVTGIRLISSNHPDVCLGYIHDRHELFYGVTGLCGFILAIGPRGVQAIQVIDNNGHISRWFGNPKDAPVTERLAAFEAIAALEVGVDGYKLVSIATAGHRPIPRDSPLRTTAMWYPTVPSPGLYLNESSFIGESPLTSGYQPLAWIHFGGSKGMYLQSIRGICVNRGSPCSIEFEYDTEDIPAGVRKLGRRMTTDFSRFTRFQIDGGAGEFIEAVYVNTDRAISETDCRFWKHGMLRSFKVTTNHGRSAHFKPNPLFGDEPPMVPLSITPGTTLTGLYASQDPECGLITLGAISEVVDTRK